MSNDKPMNNSLNPSVDEAPQSRGVDRDAGLNLLFADLYASEDLDLERLVAYAKDPEAMSTLDRTAVEEKLESDPSWTARLRVLQTFPQAAAADDQNKESRDDAATLAPVIPFVSRHAFKVAGTWIATAVAASLLIWLIRGDGGASVEPVEVVTAPPARQVEPTPLERGDVEPVEQMASIVPVDDLAKVVVVESGRLALEGVDAVQGVTAPVDAVPLPSSFVEPEVELAMMSAVAYATPFERAMRGLPDSTLRSEGVGVSLAAWVPDHVARSATAQPTLYWTIDGPIEESDRLGVVITSEIDPEPIYEDTLAPLASPGRQSIELAGLNVALAQDTIYRWTVFVRRGSNDPSEDRIAQGWVQYRPAQKMFTQEIEISAVAERAAIYADSGYWYDALAALVQMSDAQPENQNNANVLAEFLRSAGIE